MLRRRYHSLIQTGLGLAMAVGLAVPSVLPAQTLRTFTVDDALRVRSASVAAATDDARWLAVTVSDTRSRLGTTDHFRYGDPTYVSSSRSEVMKQS